MYISASRKSEVHTGNGIKKSLLDRDMRRLISEVFKEAYPEADTELDKGTSPDRAIVAYCRPGHRGGTITIIL